MATNYKELKHAIRDFIDNHETITVNKHHYVRKTGLKRGINKILRGDSK